MSRFAQVLTRHSDKLKLLAGYEETILATTAMGGEGSICALFSLPEITSHYWALIDAFGKHQLEDARRHQKAIATKCEELRADGNFLVAFKNALNKEGQREGFYFGNPRAPVGN